MSGIFGCLLAGSAKTPAAYAQWPRPRPCTTPLVARSAAARAARSVRKPARRVARKGSKRAPTKPAKAARDDDKDNRSLFLKAARSLTRDAGASMEVVEEVLRSGWRGGAREYQTLFGIMGSKGLWQCAAVLLSQMLGVLESPDLSTYCAAMRAFGRSNAWEHSLDILAEMRRRDVKPDGSCYSALLLGLGKAGEWSQALRLLQEAQEEDQLEANLFEVLVTASKQVVARIDVLRGHEMELDLATYSTSMADVERLADGEEVLDYLDDLRSREVILDSSVYHAAVTACTRGQHEERLAELLEEAAIGDTEHQGSSFLDTALSAYSASNNWECALQLLNRHPAGSADSFSHVRSACLLSGQWQLVLELWGQPAQRKEGPAGLASNLLDELRGQGLKPTAVAFDSLMTLSARSRQWEQSAALLEEMRGEQITPTAASYSTAMSTCEEVEIWPKAVALLEEMQRRGPPLNADVCIACIKALQAGGEWELAVRLLQAMPTWGIEPDLKTYNAVLLILAEVGEWQSAVRLLEDMKSRRNLQPDLDSYNIAIATCQRGNQWQWALHLFNDMKEVGLVPNRRTYGLTIAACDRGMQVEWVERLTAEFSELNEGDEEASRRLLAEFTQSRADEDWTADSGTRGDAEQTVGAAQTARGAQKPEEDHNGNEDVMPLEEKYEGAATMFRLAVKMGSFQPWKRADFYDLHGMSVDVAETAVYEMLRERLLKPKGHRDLWNGVTIVVGKGLHSEGEPVVGPAIEKLLKEDFKMEFHDGTEEGSLRIPASELQRVKKLGLFANRSS